jgi:hypothetical protein
LFLGAVINEPYGYRTVLNCLKNVWCVFMGLSVSVIPATYRVRALFMLIVWYSCAMSTIFQSIFITFLMSPVYVSLTDSFNIDIRLCIEAGLGINIGQISISI